MDRATLKAEIVEYMRLEIGDPSSAMIKQTFGAIKHSIHYEGQDLRDWASQYFSASRQSKMLEFAIAFQEVCRQETKLVDAVISEFYDYCSERFGDGDLNEELDSSGLPWLSGSEKTVNWAFMLRKDALNRCSSIDSVERMKAEILRERSATYWIKNYK